MRRTRALTLAAVLLLPGAAAAARPHPTALPDRPPGGYAPPGTTERVSLDATGMQAGAAAFIPSISGDGSRIAFATPAALVADDSNGVDDVYVRDLLDGRVQRVSLAADGSEANERVTMPRLARDAGHVAFVTSAALVPDDTNGATDVYVRDLSDGTIERVSVSTAGEQGNAAFSPPALTPDGRYVVFHSQAGTLVDDDTNGTWDVFIRDRHEETTERVSITDDGNQADTGAMSASWTASVSDDGRYVAFGTYATNFAEGDKNGVQDVFVRDRVAQRTEHISVSSEGGPGNSFSANPEISADGRYVAFWSMASNLVPEDTTGAYDVFVRDRVAGTTERVSMASDGGTEGDSHNMELVMTPDARFVAYLSISRTIVDGDRGGLNVWDVHVHDRTSGFTERVSVASDGTAQATEGLSLRQPYFYRPDISDDGRYVVFGSDERRLVPGDNNDAADLFLRDRGPVVGIGRVEEADEDATTTRVSGWARFSAGTLAASTDRGDDGDPRWTDLGGELTGASVVYRPERNDLFVRLDLAQLPAVHGRPSNLFVGRNGVGRAVSNYVLAPGVLYAVAFKLDEVRYEVRTMRVAATAVPPQDPRLVATQGYVNPRTSPDSYFGLFRCDQRCEEVARLAGGLGRRGRQVTASVPVTHLNIDGGATLADLRAYAAVGEVATGPVQPLDDIDLGDAVLPAPSAAVGSAPAGAPLASVVFHEAPLQQGRFTASLSDAGPDDEIWVKSCLGDVCDYERAR